MMRTRDDLRPYQVDAIKWLLNDGVPCGRGLFAVPGAGKTAAVLWAIWALKKTGRLQGPALVVAPPRVAKRTWLAESREWLGLDLRIGVAVGPPAKRAAVLASPNHDVVCVSYGCLAWLIEHIGDRVFDMIVADESTAFKNSESACWKHMIRLGLGARRRIALTGTPAAQGRLALWGQMTWLCAGGGVWGEGFRRWRRVWCYEAGFEWKIRTDMVDQFETAVAENALHIGDDVLVKELPELVVNELAFDLGQNAKRVYHELEREALAMLTDGASVDAIQNVTTKLLQVSGGAVIADDGEVHAVHSAKLDVLGELVASGEPLLVMASFRGEIAAIVERFGASTVSDRSLDAWNRGELSMLVANPRSIGHGLNLQSGGGRQLVWFSPTWSHELWAQARRRLWRPGQRASVVFEHRIVADQTIDHDVWASVTHLASDEQVLLNALKRRQRRGFP